MTSILWYFTATCASPRVIYWFIHVQYLQLLGMISTHSQVSEHWFYILWWNQPTPMRHNSIFISYFMITCDDIIALPGVITLILWIILQLPVMISAHPRRQNICSIFDFIVICDDIHPLPGVRTLISYCNLQLLVTTWTHSQVSEHWFYMLV